MTPRWATVIAASVLALCPCAAQVRKAGGSLAFSELYYLKDKPGYAGSTGVLSGQLEAEFALQDLGRLSLKGVAHYDLREGKGRYADLPVAKYAYAQERWRLDLGFDTIFWGVVESQRLVNVVNQVDPLRSLRGDVTLGQPMLAATWFGERYKLETLVLPWFRERRFGGSTYRSGLLLSVDERDPLYQDSRGRRHVDHAVRLSGRVDVLEAGLSLFQGTLREPRLVAQASSKDLRPLYVQGQQIGLDAQYTRGATLFKLEAKQVRPRNEPSFRAAVYGFEQALGRIGRAPFDLSVFIEHNWDSRGEAAPNFLQNDLFMGLRLDFANTLATVLTLGLFQDLDHGSRLGRVLLETRLTDELSLAGELYLVSAKKPQDRLFGARDLEQVSVKLKWNF